MSNKAILSALMAVCLAASTSAFAQHANQGNDRYDRADQTQHDNGRSNDQNRGAGPRHDMHRGDRLGKEYRGKQYVVNDWRTRKLSQPPKGHHWVRAGNDYVLAAIATGVIAQVLLNH